MPRVPVLNRPQIATAPAPVVQRPLAAEQGTAVVLGEVAQGVGQLGQIIERERVRFDEIRTNEAEVAFRQRVDDILLNPRSGALQAKGTRALDAAERSRSSLRAALSEVESGLANDRQKAVFRARAGMLEQDAIRRLDAHAGDEIQRVDAQSHQALLATDREEIATAARIGDEAAVTATAQRMADRIALYGDRNGMDPEAIRIARAEAVSQARLLQLGTMLDAARTQAGMLDRARDLFAAHADAMTAADRAKVQGIMDETERVVTAQRAEDEIVGRFPGDERAALAEARERFTGELRDRVVQRIEARYADERRLEGEAIQRAVDDAMAVVDESGDFDRIPVATLQFLRDRKPSVLQALRARAKQVRADVEAETDWTKWQEVTEMTAEELRAMNPQEFRPYLSDALYKELLDRRAVLGATGGRAGREPATPITQIDGLLMDTARTMGLIPGGISRMSQLKGPAGVRYTNLRTAVVEEITRARSEKGGNLSPDETRAAMQRVLDDVVIHERGWMQGGAQVVPRAFLRDADAGRELTPAERTGRMPVLRPGVSRADRWEELVNAGLSEDEATARVARELPR